MPLSAPLRNNIILSDYPYQRDIDNRLLMADLDVFDVDVLEELIYSPLKTSLDHLSDQLSVDQATLLKSLIKLSPSKLFTIDGKKITIDKEIRKYYESQIQKFDENFRPDLEFLQELLNKVSIDILPTWYQIPRYSDNIFASIIEKYLLTPKIYMNYLDNLNFDDPILNSIVKDLYSTSDLTIYSSDLIKKYGLKRETFEELLLILEYNFVCCLSYKKAKGRWQEVITPFHEWSEFCLHREKIKPVSIKDEENIKRKEFKSDSSTASALVSSVLYTPKNMREVERELKRLTNSGWIYLDDFANSFMGSLSNKDPISLKNKGKRWKYTIPTYSQHELDFIKTVILEQFWETGFVSFGTHNQKLCFCVTPFGKMSVTR